MANYKNNFFLYDRCFYYVKENEKKVSYSTDPSNIDNSIIFEYNKLFNNYYIIYLINGSAYGKLDIIKNNNSYDLHYKDQQPQNIIINDNIYVNLLLELFVTIKNGVKTNEELVKVTKQRNLNKIVYYEPDFPIDEKVKLSNLSIKSDVFSYFLELIDHFGTYFKKLSTLEIADYSKNEIINPIELDITNDFYFYDRIYELDDVSDHIIKYKNNQGGIYNLDIYYDSFYHTLDLINLTVFDKNSNEEKYNFYIKKNELDGNDVSFSNTRLIDVNLLNDKIGNCKYYYYYK